MMSTNTFKPLERGFQFLCIVGALGFTAMVIHQYLLNKDNSSVYFKTFHTDETSLYPSISLCLDNIFKEGENNDDYVKFLSGCEDADEDECTWNASYADIDYDEVTINLMDYVIGEHTEFTDKSNHQYVYNKVQGRTVEFDGKSRYEWDFKGGSRVYTSLRKPDEKCITFDIPFKKGKRVLTHSILLNNSLFPDKVRPKYGFTASFHYPKQISRRRSFKFTWNNDSKLLKKECDEDDGCPTYYKGSYSMIFLIDNVSVLKRRNKKAEPCIENWKNDDVELHSIISREIQCRPRHWNISTDLPICSTKDTMNKAFTKEALAEIPSCYNIERYSYSYSENIGLVFFALDGETFADRFGKKSTSGEMGEEIVSEIIILFAGR